MPAELRLVGGDIVELGDVPIHEGVGQGETMLVTLENTGTTNLRQITVGLKGEGAPFVQLAAKTDEDPVWAEAGEEIIAYEGTLFVGEQAFFWSRAVFDLDNIDSELKFEYSIRVHSVGRGA